MYCPYCGTSANRNRFCTRCGAFLSKAGVSATPAANGEIKEPSIQKHSSQRTGALTGLTLDQKYRLEDLLGVGGSGTVYRAERLFLGDLAAVKILHPDQTAHPNALERFRREAQIAACLNHEHVANVYDFGVSRDGLAYLVMEFVEGESLRKMIERQGKLDEAVAAEIIRQVCAAMNDAHEQGVVHRDLKPDNILVHTTPRGMQVKVLDFGISARREAGGHKLTLDGGIIGTPYYMSPEQCTGDTMDGRSDIYSLGVVLFEMLTGVLPFNSKTPAVIVSQHVYQAPPQLREINPEISPAVEAVVLRALAKQPKARPQTAAELARNFSEAVNSKNRAPSSPANPNYNRKSGKSGSNRNFALLFIAALLLLTAGGGFWRYWAKSESGQLSADHQTVSDSQRSSKHRVPPATSDPIAPVSGSTTPSTPVTTLNIDASTAVYKDKVSGENHLSKTPLKAFTAASHATSKPLRSASGNGRPASRSLCMKKRRNHKSD